MIYVIGIGIDGRRGLPERASSIVSRAGLIAGGPRHLAEFMDMDAVKVPVKGGLSVVAGRIEGFIAGKVKAPAVVLATGDPSLYGIAAFMVRRFGRKRVEIIPNVSVVQEAFARIKESANGLKVLSAHGRDRDLTQVCMGVEGQDRVAIFTDHVNTPQKIARALLKRGSAPYTAYVCESLGSRDERLTKAPLERIARMRPFKLNTMILVRDESKEKPSRKIWPYGLPDSAFVTSTGMITKEEVRAVTLSKLSLKEDSVVWDIGAGCGSVAVEAALRAVYGRVYAVEKDPKRASDIASNRDSFGASNIVIIKGRAPECLRKKEMLKPDAVFVGGGGSDAAKILNYAGASLKSGGRMVVNAVTMETIGKATEYFKKKGWRFELVQVSVAKGKALNGLNMLAAINPVFIITGCAP